MLIEPCWVSRVLCRTRTDAKRVFFKFCAEPRREFYFNPATNACVALSGLSGVEVCNRSPNRFPTALGCSRQCIRTRYPAEKCFKAALLSKCGRDDVVNGSNLWFFDGRGCHLWSFPSGKCPSGDGQLFSSAGRCRDACARQARGLLPHLSDAQAGLVRLQAAQVSFLRC
ncbi:hypothetical protein HPB51_003975 [Rhipicephalus microplus]|uniref:BPTI/Kunitz inhibitor domain-containing protein n=1 Tax=Rhipicephalus microplus TaxID=6941 RepID=A0A9J6DSG4_RHIMP|nr:hypothetical protein HPB51_003975 [Rhipicephalus microplus]